MMAITFVKKKLKSTCVQLFKRHPCPSEKRYLTFIKIKPFGQRLCKKKKMLRKVCMRKNPLFFFQKIPNVSEAVTNSKFINMW